jgi:hypothetical protein
MFATPARRAFAFSRLSGPSFLQDEFVCLHKFTCLDSVAPTTPSTHSLRSFAQVVGNTEAKRVCGFERSWLLIVARKYTPLKSPEASNFTLTPPAISLHSLGKRPHVLYSSPPHSVHTTSSITPIESGEQTDRDLRNVSILGPHEWRIRGVISSVLPSEHAKRRFQTLGQGEERQLPRYTPPLLRTESRSVRGL